MHAFLANRPYGAGDNLVSRFRIAIQYANSEQRMLLSRLDRQGFVVRLTDDASLPPLGLPRSGQILCGDELLCECRLVARSIARVGGGALELVMQPSREDDDTSVWQALRDYTLSHRAASGESWGMTATTHSSRTRAPGTKSGDTAARSPASAAYITCEASFVLPEAGDARFFSAWFDCHFAEIAARARATSSPADLRDLTVHTEGVEVEVSFDYRWNGNAVATCTRETCSWAVAEVERLFGLHPRYEASSETGERAERLSGGRRPTPFTS
ncbi:hypothetical protein LJR230_003894 [Trinickia sp. LjRoot230]|uniref:hypothetical protein n=1 Tax=Trinickia sp. LjRoot230 TaxID=3342288 RepID=UPI003ED0CDC2